MVVFIPLQFTAAIEGEFTGSPCTNMGYAYQVSVRLVFHHLLDIVLAPEMQPLSLAATDFTARIQVFKDNDINTILTGNINNGVCNKANKMITDPSDLLPFVFASCPAMFPLQTLDAV